MKLLILAENWAPRVGGIERYLMGLTDELERQGHEITVIVPAGKETVKKSGTNEGKKIKIIRRRFFWPLLKPAWLMLKRYLVSLQRKEKFDLMLCGKGLFEGLAGYYLKKDTGLEYVIFTYAMEIEEWLKSPKQKKKLTKVVKEARKIVYINEETGRQLQKIGAEERQLVKITPGLGSDWLAEPEEKTVEEIKKKYDLRQPYIITVARLIRRKGIDDLIKAFGLLNQMKYERVQLVIVGDGPENETLNHLIEKEWLQTSVRLMGRIPDEDLKAIYRAAEFFALTPKNIKGDREGFGLVYLEAAAQGKAALGTKSEGVKEAVIDGQTGILVEEGEIKAMTAVMDKLLSDRQLKEKMGQAAQARARREFSWKTRAEKILK